MKNIIAMLGILFFLSACSFQKDDLDNNKENLINKVENQQIKIVKNTNRDYFTKTTKITFPEENIKQFEKDLEKLNKEIISNTWNITYEQIIDKAKLLDYLWRTWEALKLYVDNYENDWNDFSVVYNHNLAKLYDSLDAYDEALQIYWFLITTFNRKDYLKDIAEIWKKRWNEEKYTKAITEYNKLFNNWVQVDTK